MKVWFPLKGTQEILIFASTMYLRVLEKISSMIKRVLGQPNFSPPNKRNSIIQNFLFLFHRKFKLVPFVQLNTTRYVCVNFNG